MPKIGFRNSKSRFSANAKQYADNSLVHSSPRTNPTFLRAAPFPGDRRAAFRAGESFHAFRTDRLVYRIHIPAHGGNVPVFRFFYDLSVHGEFNIFTVGICDICKNPSPIYVIFLPERHILFGIKCRLLLPTAELYDKMNLYN